MVRGKKGLQLPIEKKLTCHGTKIGGLPMETVWGEAHFFLQRNPKSCYSSNCPTSGARKGFYAFLDRSILTDNKQTIKPN